VQVDQFLKRLLMLTHKYVDIATRSYSTSCSTKVSQIRYIVLISESSLRTLLPEYFVLTPYPSIITHPRKLTSFLNTGSLIVSYILVALYERVAIERSAS
jgi:hypothetical protein